ncbi:hypothetical protein Scep_024164 [Stephania cephalantha]|uniref:Uncharacterized protein n=1 Tax=Stephania cephalantha TaxID=152367 RepID=A0AAP0F4Z2_9MAGN
MLDRHAMRTLTGAVTIFFTPLHILPSIIFVLRHCASPPSARRRIRSLSCSPPAARRRILCSSSLRPPSHSPIGLRANPPSLDSQVDDSYVPKNNIEEAILLLMILLKKFHLGKMKWDPSVMEHLIYVFSICGQASALASQIEEILPGSS